MAVTIYMAHAQADLRGALLADAQQKLAQDAATTVYYIVPNHVKFDSEVTVLQRLAQQNGYDPQSDLYAQSRLQVYSLTRLAWALLKDMPNQQPDIVQNTGLFIMVSDILREYAPQLPIFARMQAKPGFIAALVTQLVELRASRITPQDLLQILNDTTDDATFLRQTLAAKLRDLAIVADALAVKMGTDRMTPLEVLPFLATQLAQHPLENVAFYFEGFNGFTSAEWQVVQQLVQRYPVTMALLGDGDQLGRQQPGDVFFKPMTTAQELMRLAKQAQQPVGLEQPQTRRTLSQTSEQLLTAWTHLGEYRPYQADQPAPDLSVFAAENPIVEIQEVGRRIRRLLLADPDLHLRDILILARDLTPYTDHIPEVMAQLELPYFLDTDQKMANHPLVELLLNLLMSTHERLQYQNVMAILKTSLLRPFQDQALVPEAEFFDVVSYFDNYLYANKPFEARWRDLDQPFELFTVTDEVADDDVTLETEDQQINRRIETLRRFILAAFDALQESFDHAKTMREAATGLVMWLQKYHVTDAILAQRDQYLAAGELARSRQGSEVWQLFTATLDELVAIDGDAAFDLAQFKAILTAGFAGAKFSGIPNHLDQLTISEAGIVQSNRYRHLFFIGGTRTNLPAQAKTTALINDAERLIVQPALQAGEQPKYLQNTAQQQMAEENLLFYGALSSANTSVTLSYPVLDSAGKIADMSPFYQRLVSMFQTPVDKITRVPADSAALLKNYTSTPRATLSELVKLIPTYQQSSAFKALQNAISVTQQERLERVLSAPNYRNQTEILRPEFVQSLFGQQLNVSISQLESYYNNPLAYFLQYGLRLKERTTNELNVAQTGTLYHAVLEQVIRELIQRQVSLRDVTTDDLLDLVSQAMTAELSLPVYQLLATNGKMRAVRDHLAKISRQLMLNLQQAARANGSYPQAVEQLFGFPVKGALPALEFSGRRGPIKVRGKIDRLDRQDPNGVFGTIIDYKSNGKQFDWAQAFDGLQMQLLTYWQAAQKNAEALGVEAIGGAFFAKIAPERRRIADFKGDVDALLAGQVSPEIFKYRGLFVAEPDYLDSLELLDDGEAALFYQLKKKKDGQLYATSDFVEADDFGLLLQHNAENITQAGDHILGGEFPLLPTMGSLQYTPYTDILRFDRSLGDRYRPESPKGKTAILKILQEEAADEHDIHS